MSIALTVLAAVSFAAWLYLVVFHHRFWHADQILGEPDALDHWPAVVAIVPARDEVAVIGRAVDSLMRQDYPGSLSVIVVDDGSLDGTAEAARAAADAAGAAERLTVLDGAPLPPNWTGKMWAVSQGVALADEVAPAAEFLWLTDADIEHGPDQLRRLVGHAVRRRVGLVSAMVELHCSGAAERLLIPAFVFFFQKLYPFPAVNKPENRMAAAAGGCMLVRREALESAGGIESVGAELIDDCALAKRIKSSAPIWLGLTSTSRSVRPYAGVGGIWRMVARTAFTQLNRSGGLLLATIFGMVVIYLVPPAAFVVGAVRGASDMAAFGGGALALMWSAYLPTVRLYGRARWPLFALPLAAGLYTLMTVDSALRHWRGMGGGWKGRTYGPAEAAARDSSPLRD